VTALTCALLVACVVGLFFRPLHWLSLASVAALFLLHPVGVLAFVLLVGLALLYLLFR
jgi:hypothetical protein